MVNFRVELPLLDALIWSESEALEEIGWKINQRKIRNGGKETASLNAGQQAISASLEKRLTCAHENKIWKIG